MILVLSCVLQSVRSFLRFFFVLISCLDSCVISFFSYEYPPQGWERLILSPQLWQMILMSFLSGSMSPEVRDVNSHAKVLLGRENWADYGIAGLTSNICPPTPPSTPAPPFSSDNITIHTQALLLCPPIYSFLSPIQVISERRTIDHNSQSNVDIYAISVPCLCVCVCKLVCL